MPLAAGPLRPPRLGGTAVVGEGRVPETVAIVVAGGEHRVAHAGTGRDVGPGAGP